MRQLQRVAIVHVQVPLSWKLGSLFVDCECVCFDFKREPHERKPHERKPHERRCYEHRPRNSSDECPCGYCNTCTHTDPIACYVERE
jgi:hypothetical protein